MADQLKAAAQAIIDDALEGAEDNVHVCDRNNIEAKLATLKPSVKALYDALSAEPVSVPTVQAGDWQQYAREGESAQDVIERERKDNDALCTLLARARSAAPSQPVADHIGDANEMMPATVQAKALTDDLVDWDRISEAAKQACNEYGQWMPERWLQLFVNAYNRNKS